MCICYRFWCFCWGYSQTRHQCPQSESSACFESKTPATFSIKAERISWGWTTDCKSTGTNMSRKLGIQKPECIFSFTCILNLKWCPSFIQAVSKHEIFMLCIKWKSLIQVHIRLFVGSKETTKALMTFERLDCTSNGGKQQMSRTG